jgi:endonuclease/exonuclease/phosphatase family metal-dependent hydrolase
VKNSELLRVVTYNVHKCRGLDRRVRPARIADVLRVVDADVIALQEVIGSGNGCPGQATELAEELGMHWVFGENRKLHGAGYGNAVLSRLPLASHRNLDLTVPGGHEERGCLCVDIDMNGAVVHLFNLHLGTDFFERREQARKLVTPELIRPATLQGPRIVLGDFNEWTRGLVSHVLAAEFRSADIRVMLKQKRTYPGVFPFLHVDHIYYDEALLLESVHLHRSRMALIASDHLPLVAEFRLKRG